MLEQSLRVTSIRSQSPRGFGGCIFTGKPIDDQGNVQDAAAYYVVKANGPTLGKTLVQTGQWWRVAGEASERLLEVLSSTTPQTNTVSDIVSVHLNYQPGRNDTLSARVAGKYNVTTSDGLRSTYGAQLLHGRWTHDISQDWDVGVQVGLRLGDGGTQQHSLGAEIGYQLSKGLWLSTGYNLLGVRDPDLAGADYTDSGFYIRLRFKFDENLLGGS